jgi:hypothetical protein
MGEWMFLGTSWRSVVSFTPRPLYPWNRAPGTHWIGGWVGPRASLDDVEKKKFIEFIGTRTPTPSVVRPVASRYTDYVIPARKKWH